MMTNRPTANLQMSLSTASNCRQTFAFYRLDIPSKENSDVNFHTEKSSKHKHIKNRKPFYDFLKYSLGVYLSLGLFNDVSKDFIKIFSIGSHTIWHHRLCVSNFEGERGK